MSHELNEKPRHAMSGIEAVFTDIDRLRSILNNPQTHQDFPITMTEHKNRQRELELRRLYRIQERFAQTGE